MDVGSAFRVQERELTAVRIETFGPLTDNYQLSTCLEPTTASRRDFSQSFAPSRRYQSPSLIIGMDTTLEGSSGKTMLNLQQPELVSPVRGVRQRRLEVPVPVSVTIRLLSR